MSEYVMVERSLIERAMVNAERTLEAFGSTSCMTELEEMLAAPQPTAAAPREPSLDGQRQAVAETLVERFLFERDDSISDEERTDHERSESAKLIVKQVAELLQAAPREPTPAVDAVDEALMWLRSALDCKNYYWDPDQREAAEYAYAAAIQNRADAKDGGSGNG
jgi:hypothetical protein